MQLFKSLKSSYLNMSAASKYLWRNSIANGEMYLLYNLRVVFYLPKSGVYFKEWNEMNI